MMSRLRVIFAIFKKDSALLYRDFLFVFLSALMIVFFVVLYWILPNRVNESIKVGYHGASIASALDRLVQAENNGVTLLSFPNTNALREAVVKGKVAAGVDFPDNFLQQTAAGGETTVNVFVTPGLPKETRSAMTSVVRELAFAVSGNPLPVKMPNESTMVLGVDRSGNQVPLRDKMRPIYAFMVLIMEAIGLGALIASEVQQRTLAAILVTPARIFDVLTAKILSGTLLAFGEAIIVLLLVQGFGPSPLIVLIALLLGAVMVSGIAMIAGSAGRDLVATMFNGILILIPVAIPAFAVLFPGSAASWVKVLPSYGLVQVIVRTSFEGAGWSDSAVPLLTLAAWCAAFLLVGTLVLRRRAKLI